MVVSLPGSSSGSIFYKRCFPSLDSSEGWLFGFLGCFGGDWLTGEGVLVSLRSVREPIVGYACSVASSNYYLVLSMCSELFSSVKVQFVTISTSLEAQTMN